MTRNLDRYFILAGLLFAGVGLFLGESMGRSGNHAQMPTHAHIMLAGFVFSVLYGVLYRLWPDLKTGKIATAHFALHMIGAISLTSALYLAYGGIVPPTAPVFLTLITIGTAGIILGWLTFLGLFALKGREKPVARVAAAPQSA